MDLKKASKRVQDLVSFPFRVSASDLRSLVEIYLTGYEAGRDIPASELNVAQMHLLEKRLHHKPLDAKFLKKLASGKEDALNEILYYGDRSGRNTDFAYEVFELHYMPYADDIASLTADDVRLLLDFYGSLDEAQADEVLSEVNFVLRTGVTDGAESRINEIAREVLTSIAQESLEDMKATGSSVEETLKEIVEDRPSIDNIVHDWKPDGDKIFLTLHLSKWQTKKIIEYLKHYFQ